MPITLRVQRVKGAWLECRHDSYFIGHFMCKECSLARWVPVNSQENLEKLQVGGANCNMV